MNTKATDQLQTSQRRRKNVTLLILLAWVTVVFTYSVLKFAKVIN
jgi:hypothetical protein